MYVKSIAGEEPVVESGDYGAFRYEIISPRSTTSTLKIHIPAGESVQATPGCMLAASDNIEIKGKMKKSLKALIGADEPRHTMFKARDGSGWILLSPGCHGSIMPVPVNIEEVCIGTDAFLACIGEIESSSKSQGSKKAMLTGHGLNVHKVKGNGIVFVSSVGAVMSFELAVKETIVVDNSHLVTWPSNMDYDIKKAADGWFGSGVSGEGVVTKITGPGKFHVQTRSADVAGDSQSPDSSG